jgi:hypothetical protein
MHLIKLFAAIAFVAVRISSAYADDCETFAPWALDTDTKIRIDAANFLQREDLGAGAMAYEATWPGPVSVAIYDHVPAPPKKRYTDGIVRAQVQGPGVIWYAIVLKDGAVFKYVRTNKALKFCDLHNLPSIPEIKGVKYLVL